MTQQLVSGPLVSAIFADLLSRQVANNSAGIVFNLPSSYDEFEIRYNAAIPASNAQGWIMVVSNNGGSSYQNSNYGFAGRNVNLSGTGGDFSSSGSSLIHLSGNLGCSSSWPISGSIKLHGLNLAVTGAAAEFRTQFVGSTSGTLTSTTGDGFWTGGNSVNAVQIQPGSGNITSGNFYLFGVRKA